MYGPVHRIDSHQIKKYQGKTSDIGADLDAVPAMERQQGWTEVEPALLTPTGPHDVALSDAEVVAGVHHRRAPTEHVADLGMLLESENEGEDYRPAGQHLLIDMRNIAASFLDSEAALSQAMVDVVKESGLTLLSYHCHKLMPAGVSCVGVLLESHISFHTWPDEGVITIDLFTCGPKGLMSAIPIVERLFGIPRKEDEGRGISEPGEDPTKVITRWAHQLRGFRIQNDRANHYLDDESDLALWVLTQLDHRVKEEVISFHTKYQRVDIWDIIPEEAAPSYYDMLAGPFPLGDPKYVDSDYVRPTRTLFLDGTIQSLNDTERVYHEALVHPAMFAHRNPKRVAIVGGGEGATLREILKHKTVEQAVMLEIDEELVKIARDYLPSLCDCSNQVGATPVCFDDKRADVKYTNAIEFFMENYDLDKGKIGDQEKFDVIVVDALDPEDGKDFADALYGGKFVDAMIGSLSPEGVIVIQVGSAPTIHDPPEHRGMYSQRDVLFKHLEMRLNSMLVYEEGRCGFYEPHSFVVGCMSNNCRSQWYANSDVIDDEIYQRIHPTVNKEPQLVHFDGNTQHGYTFTPRAWEDLYCRREPVPKECQYRQLDTSKEVIDWEDNFEIRRNEDNIVGIYTTREIEEGSYIMAEMLAASIFMSTDTRKNLVNNTKSIPEPDTVAIENFINFSRKNGRESLTEGPGSRIVEIGPSTLARKIGEQKQSNTARLVTFLPTLPVYSPVFERNRRMFDVLIVATQDITKGEEVVMFDERGRE